MFVGACLGADSCVGRQCKPAEPDGRVPVRAPTSREAGDSGVSMEMAKTMPWFPTHEVVCEGRPCRPGEGNLKHRREQTERGWRYKQWTQPCIHREAWVQHRSRDVPHFPDPATTYAALVAAARRVATDNLVIVTAGDWDYRELVLNWVAHVRRLRHRNALVLAMDRELANELARRQIASADLSVQLARWNETCLQRHVQAVRTERHVAVAALLRAGLDVLHTDATAVFVRDFVPQLHGAPRDAYDVLVQRDAWPANPMRKVGTATNAGFYYVRADKDGAVARLVMAAVERGLIEFYLRWNNIPDQYGWSYVLSETKLEPARTSPTANDTAVGALHPRGSHCKKRGTCLKAGWLPFDEFPRTGDWARLKQKAAVYHLTYACMQEQAPCSVPGVRPFRGHRQRLDRYDDVDFDDQKTTLQGLGLWLQDVPLVEAGR